MLAPPYRSTLCKDDEYISFLAAKVQQYSSTTVQYFIPVSSPAA